MTIESQVDMESFLNLYFKLTVKLLLAASGFHIFAIENVLVVETVFIVTTAVVPVI